ncbi:MAG: MFS transporter, partial [Pseudomonadota bacterium]
RRRWTSSPSLACSQPPILYRFLPWMIAMLADSMLAILIAQCLHAATFGIFHAAAIQLIHQLFTGRHQGRGQALYSSLSFGAGGAVGSLYSGYAWDNISASASFTIAALVSVLALLIAWRAVYAVHE